MTSLALQVDIAAPVNDVFEFVADYRNALLYMDHFSTFQPLTRHTYGLGAKVRAGGRMHGIPISTDLQIVEFEKNRKLVSVSQRGIRSFSHWVFEPYNGGTRVTFMARYEFPHLPLAGALIDKMADDSIKVGTRRTLERLKRVLENRRNGRCELGDE